MQPRAPRLLDPVFADPDEFLALVHTNGPFPSLQQRVMTNAVESAAITGEWVTDAMIAESSAGGARSVAISASYRSYWARATAPLRAEAAWLLTHEPFLDAARALYPESDPLVRPDEIYVNVQVPQQIRPGSAHVDIPKFRGIGRREFPVWLLTTMRRSQMFERWRVPVATAVCWFYDGPGGTYTYWPEGAAAAPRQTTHPFTNTAVVGENDTMFHRGDAVGPTDAAAPVGLTLDCVCEPVLTTSATRWRIRDADRVVAEYDAAEMRIALSWSAEVYVDDHARRVADEHRDDLTIDAVIDAFVDDLRVKGHRVDRPTEPLRDVQFIARLARAYRVVPTIFPTTAETEAVARTPTTVG